MALRAPGNAEMGGAYQGVPGSFREQPLLSPSQASRGALTVADSIASQAKQDQAETKAFGSKAESLMAMAAKAQNEDAIRAVTTLSSKFQMDIALDIYGADAVNGGAVDASQVDQEGLAGVFKQEAGAPGTSGLLSLKGRDAIDSTLKLQEKWTPKIEEYVKESGLSGKYADAARAALYGDLAVSTKAMAAHEATQRNVFHEQLYTDGLKAGGEQIRLVAKDPTANFDQMQAVVAKTLAGLSVNIKGGPAERQRRMNDAEAYLMTQYADSLSDENPKAAENFLSQLKEHNKAKLAQAESGRTTSTPGFDPAKQPGLVEAGTIDVTNRPQVPVGKGQTATVRSITVGLDDGKAAVLPTISADGKQLSPQQAMAAFKVDPTKHLGIFDSEKNANAYAIALHKDQEDALRLSKAGPTISTEALDALQVKARAIRVDRLWGETTKAVENMPKAQADAYIAQVAKENGLLNQEEKGFVSQADHVRIQKRQEAVLAKQQARDAFDTGLAKIFWQKGKDNPEEGFKAAVEFSQKYGPNVGLGTMASGLSTFAALGRTVTEQTEDQYKASQLSAQAKAGIPINTTAVLADKDLSRKTKRDILGHFFDYQAQSYTSLRNQEGKEVEAGKAKIFETYSQDVLKAADGGKMAYGYTWDQASGANFVTWMVEARKGAKDATHLAQIITKGLAEFGSSGFMGGANISRAEVEMAADRPYLFGDKARLAKIHAVAKDKIPADVYGIVESVHQEENKRLAREGKLPMPFNGASLLRFYEGKTPAEWKAYKAKTSAAGQRPYSTSSNRVAPPSTYQPPGSLNPE